MASPHVAGEAALVRGAHTGWSVEEVKAAIMNTATQDVFVGPKHTGDVYGPERVGSGRVRADQAVTTSTLAYVTDNPGAVSVSFGPVAVTAAKTTLTRTVRIVNKRPTGSASYTIGYQAAHATPGVTYSFSPNQVTVPPGRSMDVKVVATITRSALRSVQDPTTSSDPLGVGIQRSRRTDASGRMVLTPVGATSGSALRVPVWSAPRPASMMAAASTATVSGSGPVTSGSLSLKGAPVAQGDETTGYLSTVSTFQLQGSSPRMPSCSSTQVLSCISLSDDRSADLRYVGSASDAPVAASPEKAMLSFGVSSYGPWRTPASYSEFDVLLDTDRDGTADAAVYNTRASASGTDYDYFLAELVDLRPGANQGAVLDDQLVNDTDGAFDTNVFNSDSLALPVSLGVLMKSGLVRDAASKVNYWVSSYSAEAGQVDAVGSAAAPLTLTVGSPALAAFGESGTLLNADVPDASLVVRRDDASYSSDKPKGLLVIHHLNTDGARSQAVAVKVKSSTKLTSSSTSYVYGGRPTFTATVAPATATGTVSFTDNGKVVKTVPVTKGKATWQASGQTRGTHRMTAEYHGDATTHSSISSSLSITVKGKASSAKVAADDRDFTHGHRSTLTASLSPSGAIGSVTFRDGAKVLGSAKVVRGKAALRGPLLARGRHSVTATYNGSTMYAPSTSSKITITVR